MTGICGLHLSKTETAFIRDEKIGFVLLFSRNFSSPAQIQQLTSEIHQLTSPPPAIFMDQEGGPIVRLGEQGSTVISPMGLAATGRRKNAKRAGKIIGKEMRSLGIDGVFAPVLDVNTEQRNPVIGIRAFSDRPSVVSEYGLQFFRGLRKGKILACGKHFPGHGHTTADSHLELPVSEIDRRFLSETNLPPFTALVRKKIPALMTAHVRFPALSDRIATFSPELTHTLLRDSMGFNGVLFSDCIEMKAIGDYFKPENIISGFIESSLDVISVSHSMKLLKKLLQHLRREIAAGSISARRVENSLARISELKKKITKKGLFERFSTPELRKYYRLEKKLAEQSITLLKNSSGHIPLSHKARILIIDPNPGIHSAHTRDTIKGDRYLFANGDRYFSECSLLVPQNDSVFTDEERIRISKYEHILVFDHSWSYTPEKKYTEELFRMRKDPILICANSPYIAERYKYMSTIILTYGSRKVQMEALFNILSGNQKTRGKLPVTISQEFPAGFGI